MKILILANNAEGLYLFRREIILGFIEKGYECVASVPPEEDIAKLEELGCRVIPTAFRRRGMNPFQDLKLYKTYQKIIKSELPDVVLTYTIKPNIYGGIACRRMKIPYIVNITGLGTAIENQGFMSNILLLMYKVAVNKAECVFFQNTANMEFMNRKGVAVDNHVLLPGSGVNLASHPFISYPSEDKNIQFLAVFRVMKDKGIEELLIAAKKICSRHNQVRFVLAGEYEEESQSEYQPMIEQAQREGFLTYLGHRNDIPDLMGQSHVIVHPSYHEGMSNVLLEAAATGRMVLASNVHGCIETFDEGISGYQFEVKNAKALEEAIEKTLMLSPEQRENMGMAGRKWVESHFDRNLILKIYLEKLEGIAR